MGYLGLNGHILGDIEAGLLYWHQRRGLYSYTYAQGHGEFKVRRYCGETEANTLRDAGLQMGILLHVLVEEQYAQTFLAWLNQYFTISLCNRIRTA